MAKPNAAQRGKNSMTGVIGVVMLILGVAAGYYAADVRIRPVAYDDGYRAGSADTKKKDMDALDSSGLLPKAPGPTMSLSATVKSVDGRIITVDAAQANRNPFATPAPSSRQVNVTADTKFFKVAPLAPEELQAATVKYDAEVAAYRKSGATGQPPAPLQPIARTAATIDDISTGSAIVVIAATDIADASSFDATEIDIQPTSPVGASAPVPPSPGTVPPAAPGAQ